MLQKAVPSKTLSQIKNHYYDHKKQFTKQKSAPQANGSSNKAKTASSKSGKLSSSFSGASAGDVGQGTQASGRVVGTSIATTTAAPLSSVNTGIAPVANRSGTATPLMEQQNYQTVTLEDGQEVMIAPDGTVPQVGQKDIWAQANQLSMAIQQQQQQQQQQHQQQAQQQQQQHELLNQQSLLQQASWVAAAQQVAQARAQAAALRQQQQQQQEASSAAALREFLETQGAGSQIQNVNIALAQSLAAGGHAGGGFSAAPSQSHINTLALAGLLGQNASALPSALGMQSPDDSGLQANINAALLSQLSGTNASGQNGGAQRTSTPPADALAFIARLSGANNGDGRQL